MPYGAGQMQHMQRHAIRVLPKAMERGDALQEFGVGVVEVEVCLKVTSAGA